MKLLIILIMSTFMTTSLAATKRFSDLFPGKKPILGVVNIAPLSGEEGHPGMRKVISEAIRQMEILERNGVDAVLFENGFSSPHRLTASRQNIVDLTKVMVTAVKKAKSIIIGFEFLLNDPKASLKIAKDSGATFIRTDYYVDRMTREEYGEMWINPEEVLAYRKEIEAEHILILTDIQVKYATMLDPKKTIAQSAQHARRKKSDGIVVSGSATGSAPAVKKVCDAKKGAGKLEVIMGSGTTHENLWQLFKCADGAIVGTDMMTGSIIVDWKVKRFMRSVRKYRRLN